MAEIERLRAAHSALKALDDMIFNDPQTIERAGEMRAVIWNALEPDRTPALTQPQASTEQS